MTATFTRRSLLAVSAAAAALAATGGGAIAEGKLKLRLSSVNSETDQRAIAMMEKLPPPSPM